MVPARSEERMAVVEAGEGIRKLGDFALVVARRFRDDRCLLHASALTYTSLLSIVPLLALMFAVLKGLGAQRGLESILLSRLALPEATVDRLISYIENTNFGTLGTLGALGLLTTVISVLGAIESSFNHIWRVRHARSWWRMATDYLSAVLVTPFLLLAAVGITSFVQQHEMMQKLLADDTIGPIAGRLIRLAPYAINVVILAILFAIMPNRRPHARSLLAGALVGGVVWQFLQSSYVALQFGVARYNAIYGALAQLPVTLVWIYVSWVVVLASAEIAAVLEMGGTSEGRFSSRTSDFGLALEILVRAGTSIREGGPGVDLLGLARDLRCDPGHLSDVSERLREAGLVATEEETGNLILTREPARLDLAAVEGWFERATPPYGCDPRIVDVLDRVEARRHGDLSETTLADLLDERIRPNELRH